jgi:hypothetical protein
MIRQKNNNLFTPFLESKHTYKDVVFYVDYCGYDSRGNHCWQCSDSRHWVRERGISKEEAIEKTHISWDLYIDRTENKNA